MDDDIIKINDEKLNEIKIEEKNLLCRSTIRTVNKIIIYIFIIAIFIYSFNSNIQMRNNKEENFGKNKNDNINLNITEKNHTKDK